MSHEQYRPFVMFHRTQAAALSALACLVLAVALPALERMDEARLRALLRAQLASATPEMLPVLLALARARLGPAAIEELTSALEAGEAPVPSSPSP